MESDLKALVGPHEKILWEGKPNKKCYIFESIFNPLLPIALIWGLIDLGFIGATMLSDMGEEGSSILLFIIPFFAIHLMPVWMYLGGVLMTFRRYRNTYYIVTDNAIYTSGGIFSKHFNSKPFAEMSHVNLKRGVFDQMFGVGDIVTTSSSASAESGVASVTIDSVSDYTNVYNLIKKLQKDIYTDIMYPNDKRPGSNHGYKTEYKG